MLGMTKREIILITAALVAVVFGINALWGGGSNKGMAKRNEPTPAQSGVDSDYAVEIAGQLGSQRLSEYESHLMSQTQLAWGKSPFLAAEPPVELDDAPDPESVKTPLRQFNYSGYVQMRNELVGVINGMEYQVGETLVDDDQLVVSAIYPDHVVITEISGVTRYTVRLDDGDRDGHQSDR